MIKIYTYETKFHKYLIKKLKKGKGKMRKSILLISIIFFMVLFFVSNSFCAPAVTLKPSVTAGQNAISQSFHIKNDGGGALTFTVASDSEWAIPGISFGGSSIENNLVFVKYSTLALAVGTYSATITVESPEAGNSPQTVFIQLTVTPKPAIGVTE